MTVAAAALAPNAGVPQVSLRRKGEQEGWSSDTISATDLLLNEAEDAMTAKDMSPEDWRGLLGGLIEFFAEEAQEPEHADDNEIDEDGADKAAGLVYVEPGGKVLLLKRAPTEENFASHWAFPGGKADAGETADQAATREAQEEIGMSPEGKRSLLSKVKTPTGMIFHTFRHDVPEQFEPKLNPEHTEHAWASLDALPEPLHPRVADTLKALPKAKDAITPKQTAEGKLSDHDESEIGTVGSEKREEMPEGVFLEPASRKYPVKEKADGEWKYNRKLLLAAARRARMNGNEELAKRADSIRAREFEGAQDEDKVEIDRSHDGPWLSCLSGDGKRFYKNMRLPDDAEIGDQTVDVAEALLSHDRAERDGLEKSIQDFKTEHSREPSGDEMKVLHVQAHHNHGTPAERKHIASKNADWGTWSEWCRNEEGKLGRGPFANEPEDGAPRPLGHGHVDASDSGLKLALDRDSVREFDQDGRMRVLKTNISKACINPYRGREIPGYEKLGLDPDRIYQMLRDPEELKKAERTFDGVQLLQKHIPVNVDDHQMWDTVGTVGSNGKFEDPFLTNSIFVWTKNGIDLIESDAQKELSCGYHYRPDMTPGNFNGIPYDGVMRDIVGNHVALVKDGRAGPDVVVGDSTEHLLMTKPTRLANIALQLTARAVRPILAKDAKIDLMPVFKDITSKNFKSKELVIALDSALKGKLAKDASMQHVVDMLDALQGVTGEKGADESVSEEQHKAMEAAANGESKLGIPEKVGKEFTSKDANIDGLKEYLKGKGVADDVIGEACDMVGSMMPPNALDADETEEEKAEREKREKEAHDAEIEAARKEGEDKAKDDMKDMVKKPAMDAAIAAAVVATKADVRATERAIRKAERDVHPYVGALPADLSFDSAEEVYRHVLTMLNVPNAKTMATDALPLILSYQPKIGQRKPGGPKMAADSSESGKSFAERHPEAARITAI